LDVERPEGQPNRRREAGAEEEGSGQRRADARPPRRPGVDAGSTEALGQRRRSRGRVVPGERSAGQLLTASRPRMKLPGLLLRVLLAVVPVQALGADGPPGVGFAQAEEGTWWCHGSSLGATLDCARQQCLAEAGGQ